MRTNALRWRGWILPALVIVAIAGFAFSSTGTVAAEATEEVVATLQEALATLSDPLLEDASEMELGAAANTVIALLDSPQGIPAVEELAGVGAGDIDVEEALATADGAEAALAHLVAARDGLAQDAGAETVEWAAEHIQAALELL